MSSPIDWHIARRRAALLAHPGPRAERGEMTALVTELREAAARAPEHVARITGLHEPAERAARFPVYVVDRPRWAEANIGMFSRLVGDLLPTAPAPGAARLAGEELGVMLSLLSSRVLGQFDPFTPAEPEPGQGLVDPAGHLLLVAPNVLQVERQLELEPPDFRLWVCLHEQTHAVQFAAAPWLRDHLASRMRQLVARISEPERGKQRLTRALRALIDTLGPGRAEADAPPPTTPALLDALLDDDERRAMAELVAVMSLLEGHADVVMDEVGPTVLPSVDRIRRSFEQRRDGTGFLDIMLRRIMGMDAKIAQYRNGAAFVRGVVAEVGHEGLAAVWDVAAHLPTPEEIAEPAAWVRRVHG